MDGETASWIFYSGLLIYGLVLFAFKRLYLDTLESRVLSYMLGLVLAYGILAGVFLASRESMVVKTVLQEALWSGRTYTYQGAGFLLVIVPAVYSIFLLRSFEKGGKNAAWKEKVQMMGSVSIQLWLFWGCCASITCWTGTAWRNAGLFLKRVLHP